MPLEVLILHSCSGVKSLEPLRGAPLRTLWLAGIPSLDDDALAVVSSLTHLKSLGLEHTKITDLFPLRGLPLELLNLTGTPVYDITPLQGMKLNTLRLERTRVRDLSPLAGMPLEWFDATGIPADDYSPLAGAPLEACFLHSTPIRDLSFLKGSPIKKLSLIGCNEARGYAVLEGLKSLDLLVLPNTHRFLPPGELAAIELLRNSPTLKNIDVSERRTGEWLIDTARSADEFWSTWDRDKALIEYLGESGFRYTLSVQSSGKYFLRI
jgi:hypothetical protein